MPGKRAMCMWQVVRRIQGDRNWLRNSSNRGFIEPILGLNVVLPISRRCAACCWGYAEPLKKIVGCPVLLNNYNDMLEARNLSEKCLSGE